MLAIITIIVIWFIARIAGTKLLGYSWRNPKEDAIVLGGFLTLLVALIVESTKMVKFFRR